MTNIIETNGYEAWQAHRRIVALRQSAEQTFLELGAELYWFERKKFYQHLDYDTFEAYLASPDVDISRRVAFRIKGIYEDLQLKLKMPPETLLEIGNAKLDMIRPHATEDNVDELLNMASTISKSDLRIELANKFKLPVHQVAERCVCPLCGDSHMAVKEVPSDNP